MEKILVIEDNDLLRENISEILSMEGYDVFSAENGLVGVEKATAQNPDLIVSDVNMPVMDGFEVLEALRANDSVKTIPFIFLTVKNTMNELRTGMNLGADDYLTKPFDMRQLLTAVKTRLNKKNEIVEKEGAKYNELKNAVGLPITSVIDDPLRNIERLAELVTGQMSDLSASDVSEITKLIATDASKLRKDVNKVLFFYRVEALKNNQESLAELTQFITPDADQLITYMTQDIGEEFNRNNDFQLHLEGVSLNLPQDFLDYIIKELLSNACRYSTKGTPIKITGQKRIDGYQITIQDQGIGFSDGKTLEHIAPYIRLNQEKCKSDGLGLGLYNVKTLAELFNAKLSLVSEPGLGSSISISFRQSGAN